VLDLVDARGRIMVAEIDQRSRVGGVEQQIADEVGALRVGRPEPVEREADEARHAVHEALRDERDVFRRADDERLDAAASAAPP
jgi:hypothetical protein